MANSVDSDQMLCSAASDLGLHYFQRSICPSKGYYGKLSQSSVGLNISSLLSGDGSFKVVCFFQKKGFLYKERFAPKGKQSLAFKNRFLFIKNSVCRKQTGRHKSCLPFETGTIYSVKQVTIN